MRKAIIYLCFFAIGASGIHAGNSYPFGVPSTCISPPSRIEGEAVKMNVTGEFLYWTADSSALYYAQDMQFFQTTPGNSDALVYSMFGELHRVGSSWNPAFRVSGTYHFFDDKWDVTLGWTRFAGDKSSSYEINDPIGTGQGLLTLWGHTSHQDADYASCASGKWDLKINTFDIEWARSFMVGRKFSMRAFAGPRIAWIDQTFDIHYDYLGAHAVAPNHPSIKGSITANSDFRGAGVRGGFDLLYTFNKNWGIFGKTAAATLYGRYNGEQTTLQQEILPTPEDKMIGDSINTYFDSATTAQLALGFEWKKGLSCDKYFLLFRAAWEQNIWFGASKFLHYIHKLSEGLVREENENVTLQGLSLSASFDF